MAPVEERRSSREGRGGPSQLAGSVREGLLAVCFDNTCRISCRHLVFGASTQTCCAEAKAEDRPEDRSKAEPEADGILLIVIAVVVIILSFIRFLVRIIDIVPHICLHSVSTEYVSPIVRL